MYLQVSGSLSYVSWLIPRSERQYRVNIDTMKVVIKSDCAVKVTFVCKMLKLSELSQPVEYSHAGEMGGDGTFF